MSDEAQTQLLQAARIVAGCGLADAFGHVSARVGTALLITAPVPLAFQSSADLTAIPLDTATLPPSVPKEAWIHLAIARADASTVAICRAQPRAVARAVAARRSIRPLDGHGALLGPLVPVFDDSRLVRDAAAGVSVAEALADAPAVILRGNGAVTRGPDLASAVARMWLLERSADLALAADPEDAGLPDDEQAWWRERDAELLPRIYDYLARVYTA
jgi:HCOMODA/2-hydroxy-3-carboxy-muconic semialdehyde decarboxylase